MILLSDKTWKSSTGPIRMSNIYDGEMYDAHFEIAGWDTPDYDDSKWSGVILSSFPKSVIVASEGAPVIRIEELKPVKKIITPKKEVVLDFGQNLTGRVKFTVKGKKGDTLIIHHAEVLDKEGNFYTENLRSAKQQITYVLKMMVKSIMSLFYISGIQVYSHKRVEQCLRK
ncbi:MAG: family 78 glycoside hydrolase catalytic domain [Bacteroidales bacterium]|nr:family 78 glycoside hydrolase catalytic domain [Bacteroidales bacterium]